MSNGINNISPNLRDYLLNKNLILADTIVDAGLTGLAVGLGQQAKIETLPNAVQPSTSIEDDGKFYRDLSLSYNPYKSQNENEEIDINTNTVVNIGNLPPGTSPVEYQQNVGSKNEKSSFSKFADEARTSSLVKNKYYDESLFYEVNLNTVLQSPENVGAYQIRNSLLARGVDFTLNAVNLGGISQQFNNLQLPNTPLEEIANQQIIKHFGYNAAFGLSQETLGHINLNPLSLLKGNDILVPNYSITIPQGSLGGAVDFLSRVTGVEVPVSLFDQSSSIFTSENPVSNFRRAHAQISNTGKGQVVSLIQNLNQNKYRPTIIDDRRRENITKGDTGTNGELYAFQTSDGDIKDLLNSSEPTSFELSHGKITSELQGGFNDEFDSPDGFETSLSYIGEAGTTKFSWQDDKLNKAAQEIYSKNIFQSKNSLIYKTQALFNTNRMRTLVSGKGDGGPSIKKEEVQSNVQIVAGKAFISKGSGVLSGPAALGKIESSGATPDTVYCRTWTTFDKYNQVRDLQKNSNLWSNAGSTIRKNTQNSVLDDNGFVRIAPKIGDGENADDISETKIKRFMFSIENLAWSDDKSFAFLPNCEKGPGDPITGTRGRIMWFPPYGLNFTDNSSVNWDTTNFIGRGEPIYTYNNTERSGTLQWQIIIDHPTYINDLRDGNYNDEVFASIAAGCLDLDSVIGEKLSQLEKDKIEVDNSQKREEVNVDEQIPPSSFKIYFPNDVTSVPTNYENGDGVGLGSIMADEGYITTAISGSIHPYPDNTDFGLNSCISGDCPQGQKIELDGKIYDGWDSNSYLSDLTEYLLNKCPACRIGLSGWASQDGAVEEPDANQRLSDDRAKNVFTKLSTLLKVAGDPLEGDRFEFVQGNGSTGCPAREVLSDGTVLNEVDTLCKKQSRFTEVLFRYDPELDDRLKNIEKPKEKTQQTDLSLEIKKRYFNECSYFKKLEKEDSFVYATMKERIKYFHPAFHSITPEGFNARLNFLQQCTRQGPTLREGVTTNLAFGKPPVCILRIGDFYHTKIIIDNINFSFDPLVWDMNPEGVGVQPMICNVDMSFKFIGGSSLQGPINRLQNAVSFNFFANTEIYDDRADFIKKSTPDEIANGANEYVLVNGINPNNFDEPPENYKYSYGLKSGIGNNKNIEIDQETRAENDNTSQEDDNNSSKIIGISQIKTIPQFTPSGGPAKSWTISIAVSTEGFHSSPDMPDFSLITTKELDEFINVPFKYIFRGGPLNYYIEGFISPEDQKNYLLVGSLTDIGIPVKEFKEATFENGLKNSNLKGIPNLVTGDYELILQRDGQTIASSIVKIINDEWLKNN